MNTKTKETLLFWLAVIGGISSIGSGIIALCSDKNKAMIALFAVIVFLIALFYNEPAVVHFHADMDDVDGVAQPHLDVKIEEPISVVNFHVILAYKNKDFSEQAVFKRKLINSAIPTDYIVLETIPFNVQSKSYEYVLTNPEVGYFYRLEWVK